MSVPESSRRLAQARGLEPLFDELERELVTGGVAPRYVRRTLQELREHYEDIQHDLLAAGASPEEAAIEARAALGTERTLAAAVLAREELRDWRSEWPRAALWLDSVSLMLVLPAVPVAYCAYRGPSIARWGASIGLATLITGGLLLTLRGMFLL